ncbi:MAG: hypothetical protein PGN26_14460 [Xylophilus ampelinus]
MKFYELEVYLDGGNTVRLCQRDSEDPEVFNHIVLAAEQVYMICRAMNKAAASVLASDALSRAHSRLER